MPFELLAQSQNGFINVVDDKVEIVADKGTDLFTNTTGSKYLVNAPKLLFSPIGDFIFSVKVTASFNDSAYDGGALIVYVDELNWGKLLFEQFKSGEFGVATSISQSKGDDAYHSTVDNNELYLKIVRRDHSYIFYTSIDGLNWDFTRHFSLGSDTMPQIGFMAQSPLRGDLKATFSDIEYRGGKIKDFWQGQ